ncbi:MAG: HAMP domain-containing protein, partial [Deltaproteobacteria bacterium]|nr:HAMP domain-containing protein [Deltaproteobacteria bacterium]
SLATMSLRTRLILAFTVLIVTSASATILIGNLLFGRKVMEQALSMTELGLNVVDYNLQGRLRRLRQLTRAAAQFADKVDAHQRLCQAFSAPETPLDFILVDRQGTGATLIRLGEACSASEEAVIGDGSLLLSYPPHDAAGARCSCSQSEFGERELEGTRLRDFLAAVAARGSEIAGLGVLAPGTLAALRYGCADAAGLFLLGGAPLPGGGTLVLGALLNERTELVSAPLHVLWPRDVNHYAATIFLEDSRVATTLGDAGLGSRVDPVVSEQVLGQGEMYFGQARVMDRDYFTAYMPLRDFEDRTVGILGIGVQRDVYVDLRNRTVTLFSSLIAAGMIFGFLMTYWFSGWLVRPISELARGMDRVARGDFNHKVRISSSDELGSLARAFNSMVRAVKERDIRLREMTDERLSQMEKQVSIGRLAAGVAHEINNPLTSILSLSMMMRKHLPPGDDRAEDLDIVVEETNRCREIVRSLLDFARERPVEMKLVEIHEILRETLVLTRRYPSMGKVEISLEPAPEAIHVSCDPKQLQQVFTNLIVNAAEAMEDRGGSVRLRVDDDSSGGYVVVQVRDDGKGMTREQLARAFEPFYTTKGDRKGTGLGLSVSLGIVRRHQGTIDIESQPGRGTNVVIHLPRAGEPAEGKG